MTCLDENTVLAFVDGQLAHDAMADVEAHLSGCRSCVVLVSLAVSRADQTHSMAPYEKVAAPVQTRGSSIGRYVVLDLVGRGGMGEVYAAYDPELDRRIALKFLDDDGGAGAAPEIARARLLREAKVIAKLSHPNVVVVHDAGTIGDRVFIAMEFVHGKTLSEWLTAAPRSWPEIRAVFLAAGRGLMAAHAAGLVHRDFKPQNVMVGDDGAIRVMDFGLASEIVAAGEGSAAAASAANDAPGGRRLALTLTRTGTWLGTPIYMAPEQFRAEKADARTDQFSFCVALYEAVYGERPFAAASLLGLRTVVLAGKVREPPARSRVPAWLRKIILRGLSVDREARFPSMAELLAALERDPVRTRRRVLIGATVALLMAGGGALAQRTAAGPAIDLCSDSDEKLTGIWELPTGRADLPRRNAARAAFVATGKAHAAEAWERAAQRLDGFARRWVQMHKQSCEATHKIGEQSADVLDLRTDCLNIALEGLRAVADLFAKADADIVNNALNAADGLPDLNRCADVRLLRSLVPPPTDPQQHARVEELRRRAPAVRALGDIAKWDQVLPGAQRLLEEGQPTDYQPIIAEALYLRGMAEMQTGNASASVATLKLALPAAVAAHDDLLAAQISVVLASTVTTESARPEEGDTWASLAEAYLGRTGVGGERTRAWLAQVHAHIALAQGKFTEAVAFQRKGAAISRKATGRDGLDVATSHSNAAIALLAAGDAASALEDSRKALEICEREAGPDSPTLAGLLTNRGEILNALSRPDEALPLFDRSVAIWRGSILPDSPWFGYPFTGMGQSLLLQNKPTEAIAPLEQALTLREKGDPAPERLGETKFALARALWESGRDRRRAVRLAQAAQAHYAKKPVEAKKTAEITSWLKAHGPH